ncbi:MAG: hypothetical protein KDD77_17385 [Caldilineaceae bacterium]|nr:hypothetical protein [Caldilineaceae bacterium]
MIIGPLLRVAGRDAPLAAVVERAQRRGLPVQVSSSPDDDYAQIDPALTATAVEVPDSVWAQQPPAPGLSYAGFDPQQRGAFLTWQRTPLAPAPPACQQLYLANLEARLLESSQHAEAAQAQLQRMLAAPTWTANPATWRVALLAAWLAQDGGKLAAWLAAQPLPSDLLGVAFGMQALLGAPLAAEQLLPAATAWGQPQDETNTAVLAFRVQTLANGLGADPLAHLLGQCDEAERQPRPWRCQHRSLRLHVPQPDLRRSLEPLLVELLAWVDDGAQTETDAVPTDEQEGADEAGELSRAHVIVEFGHSRSEYFSFALKQAQKQRGFAQLLDEDRHLVYRVPFRKNEMRRFWQLWNYVQSWSTTRVYHEGRELQKWQIYPYSQYLR